MPAAVKLVAEVTTSERIDYRQSARYIPYAVSAATRQRAGRHLTQTYLADGTQQR